MPDEVNRALGASGGGYPVIVREDDGTEKLWTLSDCTKQIQARHVAWLKAKLRQEKLDQKAEQIVTADQCREDLRCLDEQFSMGEYSFGASGWWRCWRTADSAARFYQLLLEANHPEVKNWSLEAVIELVMKNHEGFSEALQDMLPKAMTGLVTKKATATPLPI